jgi:hypothetical protein
MQKQNKITLKWIMREVKPNLIEKKVESNFKLWGKYMLSWHKKFGDPFIWLNDKVQHLVVFIMYFSTSQVMDL